MNINTGWLVCEVKPQIKTKKTPTMMILIYNTVYMLNGYKIKHIILLGFPHIFYQNRYFRQL